MRDQLPTRQHEPEILRYRVPDWQDPVVLLAALAGADYRAMLDEIDGHQYVTITCPRGRQRDREPIRDVIARDADQTSLEGPRFERRVSFDDEA